jgi:hypothetical protein
VVGAPYDLDYYKQHHSRRGWRNLIGKTSPAELVAVLRNADLVVGYPSGVPILATYLETPTVMGWRPDGDSLNPAKKVCFDRAFSTAWVPPAILERNGYWPFFYGQHSADAVIATIRRRWFR